MPETPNSQPSKAMASFQQALTLVQDVTKDERADTGKYTYTYASLGKVLAECKRVCGEVGLAITQSITHNGDLFAVVTQLIHADGGTIQFPPCVLPMPREAQALGSAATYLRRYSLMAIFGMNTEDDDGKAASVAASVQPGRRTEAERMIREEIAQMPAEARKQFISDFQEQFRMGLSDLPANKHGEALAWTREWVHQPAETTVPEPTPGG